MQQRSEFCAYKKKKEKKTESESETEQLSFFAKHGERERLPKEKQKFKEIYFKEKKNNT